MNNALFRSRKTRVVAALLLIVLAVFAVGLIKPVLTIAQVRETAQEKFRKHANAIANRYIVVLRDETVDFSARATAVAEIGESLVAAYGAQIERTYKHALNGYAMEMTEAQAQALSQDPRVAFGQLHRAPRLRGNRIWHARMKVPGNILKFAGRVARVLDLACGQHYLDIGGQQTHALQAVHRSACDAANSAGGDVGTSLREMKGRECGRCPPAGPSAPDTYLSESRVTSS